MLPMITALNEIEDAQALIQRAYLEVLEEGAHLQMPKVGIMIEVPAAVYQIREFARHVDFISVGSNDLTQYLLAVDRNNRRVANLYQSFHPAVLRALSYIAHVAAEENLPLSLCGEMAGDPRAAVLLMGMGFRSLSMSATSLLRVKWVLRRVSQQRAREILEHVLRLDNASDIRSQVESRLEAEGLGSFIRPLQASGVLAQREVLRSLSLQDVLPASS
jgi:phosphotransferase system enzyme I (PtsP)